MIPSTKMAEAGKPFAPSAMAWNEFINRANRGQLDDVQNPSGGAAGAWGQPCIIATIKNATANDLTAGSIVTPGSASSIGTWPTNPHETRRRPYVSCNAPTLPTQHVYVLIDPVGAGKYGRAATLGVTVCTVNVTSQYHRFAAPYAGTDKLISSSIGPARILHKVSTTGEQSCVVLLTGVGEGLMKIVRCTSNTVASSMQPGTVVEPDGDGTWSDGATCKMRKSSGDQFRSGGEYWLQLNGWNGTEEIYGGLSSTSWEFPVCRSGVEETDRLWLYGYAEVEEDV